MTVVRLSPSALMCRSLSSALFFVQRKRKIGILSWDGVSWTAANKKAFDEMIVQTQFVLGGTRGEVE